MLLPIDMRVPWDAQEEAHLVAVVMQVHVTLRAMELSKSSTK